MTEFIENGYGGTLAGELKIDAVNEVQRDAQAVDDGVNPSRDGVIEFFLLEMQGEEEEQNDDYVGVEDGRRVEDFSCPEEFEEMSESHVGVHFQIDKIEHQPTQKIRYIYYGDVYRQRN